MNINKRLQPKPRKTSSNTIVNFKDKTPVSGLTKDSTPVIIPSRPVYFKRNASFHTFTSIKTFENLPKVQSNISSNQIKIEAPDNASKAEMRIHTLLDDLNVHKINVASYVEELNSHEKTPKIMQAFAEQASSRSRSS